jgi:uncharacterized protein YggT (Ycf19 family)
VGIGLLIARVIDFYVILIVVYAVMGWFVGMTRGGVVYDLYRVLASICEPFVGLFRRVLPPLRIGSGGIDFSPIIAILVLQFISYFVATAL